MRPKTKLFAVKFRRILEVLALRGLWKRSGRIITICASKNETVCREVQTHFGSSPPPRFTEKLLDRFSRLMYQKRSCLLWSSHTFWKLSACKFYRKSCGRNFTINASKNEAVCCVVQAHFGRFLLIRLIKKLWAHFHDLCVAQTNILDFNIFKKCFGHVL